jgi:hypothetical protein
MALPEDLGYLKCTKCGWIHFKVTRKYAEEEVKSFMDFFDSLSSEKKLHYGNKPASVASYEKCFRCGTSHEQAVEADDSDVPLGSTIQPMIAPNDFPKINLKK